MRVGNNGLVAVAGRPGSGKSTWAQTWFRSEQTVSVDRLRAGVTELQLTELQHGLRADAAFVDDRTYWFARRREAGVAAVIALLTDVGSESSVNDWIRP